ncbi:MAG: ArsR/SmtB family transcription factor [Acidiferrobacterales bacterium]
MEDSLIIVALAALAQETRLSIFRLLVQEGPRGLPAGDVGHRLGIPANALSFHLNRLRSAGLITAQRNGRQIIYAVDFEATQSFMKFLTENCCARSDMKCSPDCPPTGPDQAKPRPQRVATARRRREKPSA